MIEQERLYIGGEFATPSGRTRITVVSASTEETIGSVPEACNLDVDRAVSAARAAFDDPFGWANWPADRRADVLERFAAELTDRAQRTAEAVSSQNGMPVQVSVPAEGGHPATLLTYYAGLLRAAVEDRRDGLFGGQTVVARDPIGVVAAIVPWNFPQAIAFNKIAPALAAGCSIVHKPSPETVLDSFIMAEAAAAAGLPPGVLNIVPGGRELGAYLVEHDGVDKVSFTGSTGAGRAIAAVCGQRLRPVTLELGGKSAAILLDDVVLETSLTELMGATLLNNGQTCYVGSRVLAPRHRYPEVVDALSAVVSQLVVGDALDPATNVGPLVSQRQRDRVLGYIEAGVAEGARVTTGGGAPAALDRGFFVEPTVFADVRNDHTIAREEIFGPVLSVIPYDDDDDAVAMANDSSYGLGGSVWSADPNRAVAVARRVRTGTIGINSYLVDPGSPFGGVKDSGMGRELGPEGLLAYQSQKSIYNAP